jgi:hypothetical protein
MACMTASVALCVLSGSPDGVSCLFDWPKQPLVHGLNKREKYAARNVNSIIRNLWNTYQGEYGPARPVAEVYGRVELWQLS